MGIFRKLIGLFFLVILFFIILKSKTILPRISNWMVGPEKTPFQIGSSYIEEIYKLPSYTGETSLAYQSRFATFTSGQRAVRAITVSRVDTRVTLTVEDVAVPIGTPWVFWLSNTPDITNKTRYIDFGKISEPYTFHEYYTNTGQTKIDLAQYKYVLIVDPKTYQVYSLWTLNNN